VPLEFKREENTLRCGLRIEWLSGEFEGKEFTLTAGAGCGQPWIIFVIGERRLVADIRTIIPALIDLAAK